MLFFFNHKRRDNALPGWNARSAGYVTYSRLARGDNARRSIVIGVGVIRIAGVNVAVILSGPLPGTLPPPFARRECEFHLPLWVGIDLAREPNPVANVDV